MNTAKGLNIERTDTATHIGIPDKAIRLADYFDTAAHSREPTQRSVPSGRSSDLFHLNEAFPPTSGVDSDYIRERVKLFGYIAVQIYRKSQQRVCRGITPRSLFNCRAACIRGRSPNCGAKLVIIICVRKFSTQNFQITPTGDELVEVQLSSDRMLEYICLSLRP